MAALRIFISHKMPTDTPLAESIAAKLALYAGAQVKVTHAGRFLPGDDWRQRIQAELTDAQWVIFLHTRQDEDWAFCMYELGYFRKAMDTDAARRLITFCRKPEQLNDALKEFNAKVMSQENITELLEEIYLREPYKLSPDLDSGVLRQTAADIVAKFQDSERVEANFDIATNITIELTVSADTRQTLKKNVLPSEAAISGTREWQRLFGRDIETGGWQWSELTAHWPHRDIYGFLIATMIDDALDARMPKGTLLGAPDGQLHRLTLRRYERLAGNDKHRFYFTVAPADLPFEVTTDAARPSATALYHLLNVAWFFRRRIVEQLYERLREIATKPALNLIEVTDLFDQLGRELMQISAQAIIRRIDSPLVVLRALGEHDPEVRDFVEEITQSHELTRTIYAGIEAGPAGVAQVLNALAQLSDMNYRFLQRVSKRFAASIAQLPSPEFCEHQV